MLKESLFGALGSTLICSSVIASGSAAVEPNLPAVNVLMGLGAQDADATTSDDSEVPATSESSDSFSEMYLRINAGVNMITDTEIKSSGGIKVAFDAGLDLNVALGIPLAEDFSVEVGVGFQYNGVKELKQNGLSADVDGSLFQIPLFADLVYDFHLTDSLTLGLLAGAGFQYNSTKFDQQTIAGTNYPQETKTSWTFRYQAGLNLTWALSSSSSLGAYGRYAWAPGIELPGELELGTAGIVSLGVVYSFDF
jgi:hypothetical protein